MGISLSNPKAFPILFIRLPQKVVIPSAIPTARPSAPAVPMSPNPVSISVKRDPESAGL